MNNHHTGITMVVDGKRCLLGVITDGDARRAIMAGTDMAVTAQSLLDNKNEQAQPVVAPAATKRSELVELFKKARVQYIPLLNEFQQVVDLVSVNEVLANEESSVQAVVFAGGRGIRLLPLTERLPKPMLRVGDRPLMEVMIGQLSQAGIRQITIATHYLGEEIIKYFGDGHKYGVELNYLKEDHPLGTAGALGLLEAPQKSLLVINGDILTNVDFRAMLAYHKEHAAALTVAVRKYDLSIPYGVVETEGIFVRSLTEKPALSLFANAGIYLLEPLVHKYIPTDQRFDMTDLIQRLLDADIPVVSFPVVEYWLDIGLQADYLQAQEDMKNGRIKT